MTNIIDLRPDRTLINSKFKKYQFCSDTAPIIYEKKLQTETLRLELSSSQESWLEARLFAFHNHLIKNPYDSSCWFIDKSGGVWEYSKKESLNLIYISKHISLETFNCIYNPSIAFASENVIIICNGAGALEFLVKKDGFFKNFLLNDIGPAIILEAKYIKKTSRIIVAIYKIDEDKGKKFSRLVFLFYEYNENEENHSQNIKLIQKQILNVKGAVEHVYIEKNGNFCHIISQDKVKFEFDSLNSIKIKNDNLENESLRKIPRYCWSQDEDSITIYFAIPEKSTNIATKVESTAMSLSISIGDIILLKGETPHRLEPELTIWKYKEDSLEVELFKYKSGLMWSELIKGDKGGEYLPNETLATEIHSRLAHLVSDQSESNTQDQPTIGFNSEQLEECDLSGEENILQRIHFNSHNFTHMAMLGSRNRVLFAQKQVSGQVICIRYDHDGCIYKTIDSDSYNWDLEHTHTFPGFGYVEASKTNKKFCVSAPDGSFIAIVEYIKHAFLYENPEKNAEIGKQRILNLGSETSPILGAVATNKYLIILTKDSLYQLQIHL